MTWSTRKLQQIADELDAAELEALEERAAIIQHDGQVSRVQAEVWAALGQQRERCNAVGLGGLGELAALAGPS